MKVLIDTNIVLDVLYAREPFAEDAARVFKFCELRLIDGYVSALSIPNIVNVMRKEMDREKIRQTLDVLTGIFNIADLRGTELIKAAETDVADYEDAIRCVSAARIKADYIVTRNLKDFRSSMVPAIKPSELLERL
jgi:predicted nucleic acid-binding protein